MMTTTDNTDLKITADRLLSTARAAHKDLWFGSRKVFLAGVVDMTSAQALAVLEDCRRAGLLEFARADLVAAMDPELVKASEWRIANGAATAHFLVVA